MLSRKFFIFLQPELESGTTIFEVKFNNSDMSRAFREGKTEKTKSALNLFCAFFYEEIQRAKTKQ